MKPQRNFYVLLIILICLFPLKTLAQENTSNLVGFIATDSAINVRDRPNGTFMFSLPPNMSVAILDENSDGTWLSIELPDGRTGWVSASLVRVMESAIPADLLPITPENATQLEKITQLASTLATGLAFSPDGRLLVIYSWEGPIKVYDVRTKILVATLTRHTELVTDIAFSPDSSKMASSSWDASVKVWSTETWVELKTFKGHSSDVNSVAFSPDGQLLATTGDDGLVNVWNIESAERVHMIQAYPRQGNAVAFSPDGTKLASGGNNRLYLWDVATGEALWDEAIFNISYTAFMPDGGTIVTLSGGSAMTIMGYETETSSRAFIIHSGSGTVTSLDVHPTGALVSASAWGGRFSISDVQSQEVLVYENLKPDNVQSASAALAFSPDGRIVVTADGVQDVHIWGVRGGN